MMARLAWWLRRHGGSAALVAGTALALGALALQAWGTRPIESRLDALDRAGGPPARSPAADTVESRPGGARMQLARFYRHFEREEPLTDHLAALYALARKTGLALDSAEYRWQRGGDRKFDRYRVVLPLQGSYRSVRVFVAAALREIPTMSVEQVQFRRQDIGDETVEAQVSLTFHLAR